MRKILFTLTFLFCCLAGFSQNIHFIKSYGNSGYDYGRDIKQTPDTGYIATGSSSSFGSANADAFLLKVDSLGNFKWSYNYGGPDSDWGMSVVITHDSTYAIGGYTNSYGAGGFDFYLVRAGENGIPLWQKTYGGSNWDKADALAQVPADSGFVIVGETYSFGAGGKDMYMIRTDKNGDTLWTKTYGGPEDDWATGVLVDGDSIVVCGGTESYGAGMSDGIILKMGLDGNVGWSKVVGKNWDDYFTNIIKSTSYYCLSGSKSYVYPSEYNDFWVYKINTPGTLVMADTTWGGDQFGYDIANDVVVDPATNVVYYGGSTTSWGSADITDGITDCFISKLDGANNWMPYVQNFGDLGSDAIHGMDYCYDKGLIAIGDLDKYSTGGNNVLIVKIDKDNTYGYISVFEDVIFDDITLTISDFEENPVVSIYPNPTRDEIFFKGFESVSQLRIYDLQGNLCLDGLPEDNKLNIENLKAGTYIISIISNEIIYNVRIIKL